MKLKKSLRKNTLGVNNGGVPFITWTVQKERRHVQNIVFSQEMDNEISGAGNITSAEYWEYDARLGRRWNPDPAFASKPWMSPYHAFSNKPILNIDPNGAFDTKYEDEEGNLLANTNDGNTSTVVVKNDQKERFAMFLRIGERNGSLDRKEYNMFMIYQITPKDQGLYFSSVDYGIDYMRYSHEQSVSKDNPYGVEGAGYSTTDKGMVVLPTKGINTKGEAFENYGFGSEIAELPLKDNVITLGKNQYTVNATYHTHPNNSSFSGFSQPYTINGKTFMMPPSIPGDAQVYMGKFLTQTNKITDHYVIGKTVVHSIHYNIDSKTFTQPQTTNR